MADLRRSSIRLLALGAIVLACGLASPVVASAAVTAKGTNSGSIDACAVLPGFATPPALFHLHTVGPKKFDRVFSLQASACASEVNLPSGKYTVFQSFTASGWHLAQIYCFTVGSAESPTGTVDLPSASVTVNLKGPTACVFAELPGGSGGAGPQSAGTPTNGSTSRGGTTTSSTSSTSSTTTTTTGSTTPATFCVQNPDYPPNPPPYFCTTDKTKIG
jgi:hypothetical protein